MLPKYNYPLLLILISLFSCVANTKKDLITFPEGGYTYPQIPHPSDSNFFWYPLKNVVSPQDSILMVFGGADWFRLFDEPNLSLRPEGKIKFRLMCGNPTAIIVITGSELIIKKAKSGSVYAYSDKNKLTESEYNDLNCLRFNYPLKKKNTKHSARRNMWLDSLVALRPALLTPEYYLSLLEKAKTFDSEKFTYDTKRIPLSYASFKSIVDTIAASGYWSHGYEVPCNVAVADGGAYFLEANTPEKYNVVRVYDCGPNYSPIAIVYQYLINLAEVPKNVHISGTP